MEINVINSERVHELSLSDGELLLFLAALGSGNSDLRAEVLMARCVKKEVMDKLPNGQHRYESLLSHCKSVGLVP